MAYVFNKLAGAMDEKSNIFGGGMQGGGGESGGSPVKGQKFGLVGGGGEAAGAGGPKVKDSGEGAPQQGFALQSGASQAQIGELNKPTDVTQKGVYSDIGSAIQNKEQQLEKEAQDYTQQTNQTTSGGFYGDRDTVSKNVKSAAQAGKDSGSFSELQKFISGNALPDVKEYQSSVNTGDINIPQSQAALTEHLQRTAKAPTYTGGQARLDAALLGRSGEFQQQQQDLLAQKEALAGQQYRQQQAAQAEAEAARARYETQRGMISGEILPELQQQLLAEQSAEIAAAQGYEPGRQDYQQAFNEARGSYAGPYDYKYGDYTGDVNPADFYSRSASEDPLAYLDQGESNYYNQLATLMGGQPLGDIQQASPTFDIEGYYGKIAEAQAAREEEAAARAAAGARGGMAPRVGPAGSAQPGSLVISGDVPRGQPIFAGQRTPQAGGYNGIAGALQLPGYEEENYGYSPIAGRR